MIGNAIGDLQNDYTLPICSFNYSSKENQARITYWI
jgi:hypothetical protein